MRAATAAPVAATTTTAMQRADTRTARRLRARRANRVPRPHTTEATGRLRTTVPAVLRRTRRLRPALTARQSTTRTTRAVIARAATATRNQHTRRHCGRRPNIRRTTTTCTILIPLSTAIPATRRRGRRAADIEVERGSRGDRKHALCATAETTRNRIRRGAAGRAAGIDLHKVHAAGDSPALRSARTPEYGNGLERRRGLNLSRLRRLVTRVVDDRDPVVVRRAERETGMPE